MKKWIVLAVSFYSSAFALLPPFSQSVREISSILHDQRLYELLGSSQGVREVIRVEDGYMIVSDDYYVQASLKYTPSKNVGPASFEIEFYRPVDLKTGEEKAD